MAKGRPVAGGIAGRKAVIPKECRRLAEVDFPVAEVSRQAAREKSIRHGHPSTLHLWWARRPLAACRAVLMGLLLPDPCDPLCPEEFKREARRLVGRVRGVGDSDEALRRSLLGFIADFSNWDNSANPAFLEVARGLVRAAYPEGPPLVVDPFAGGGSIPLEALRVGCEAFASDLNPVACLILKVLLEDIPRYGPQLAEELRRVGAEIKAQAERELADLYPGPGRGDAHRVPLGPHGALRGAELRRRDPAGAFVLAVQEGEPPAGAAVQGGEGRPPRVEFEVFEPKTEKDVPAGTVARAKARCLACGRVLLPERVRAQLAAQRGGADVVFDERGRRTGGARLLAVVTLKPGEQGRHYRLPTERDYEAVRKAQARFQAILEEWERGGKQGLCPVPDEPLPPIGTLGFRVQRYGMLRWGDLFTARQKVALVTLARLVRELPPSVPEAVRLAMALVVNRCADYLSSLCSWHLPGEKVNHTYGRQALPIVWDFCEIFPFSDSTGNYEGALEWVAKVVEAWPGSRSGQVQVADATEHPLPDDAATGLVHRPAVLRRRSLRRPF
jgi:putative DNA methylase